jgi:hypothetical protein
MMSKVTASTDGPERFSPLMCRFESVLHRLKLAAEDLRDLAEEVPIVDQVPPPLLWERRRGIWNSFTTISGRLIVVVEDGSAAYKHPAAPSGAGSILSAEHHYDP